MMHSPRAFLPEPSSWFFPTLEYVGRCHADFSEPEGSVEGSATVSVDEDGVVRVEMVPEPDSLRTGWTPSPELPGFIAGEDFLRRLARGGIVRHDLSSHNPCTGLTVETPQGNFHTDDVVYYVTDEVLGVEIRSITFTIRQSAFEATAAGKPEYWVLPLANFLSECREWREELNRHPLRIFPTPEVPEEVVTVIHGPDEEQRRRDERRARESLLAANSKNDLIVFGFGEGLGFVERLPDYAEVSWALLAGEVRLKTTAVMVGPTGGEPVGSFDAMREWFPFDVLSLLTLATGTEVGSPWVEIRDGEGRLVRRLHTRFDVKAFRRGYRLIPEIPMTRGRGFKATGRLIERACGRSQKFGEAFVRAAIVHLVRSQYHDQTMDDRISHLSRGFETLCKQYRTNREILRLKLSLAVREDVRAILKEAARRIGALKAGSADRMGRDRILEGIQSRARDADGSANSFGTAVVKLLKAFWLPDAHILETHYRSRGESWGRRLNQYRGDVTHHGYLPILEEGRDVEEILDVINHLHDALARVILKILGFDGGYSPRVVPYLGSFPVGWVRPHHPARALGYRK